MNYGSSTTANSLFNDLGLTCLPSRTTVALKSAPRIILATLGNSDTNSTETRQSELNKRVTSFSTDIRKVKKTASLSQNLKKFFSHVWSQLCKMTLMARLLRRFYSDDRGVFLLLFVLALVPLLFAIDRNPFHGDEPEWISEGIVLVNLILHGDFSNAYWFQMADWYEGHVPSYIIGFWLRIFGITSGEWVFWPDLYYGINGPPGNYAIPPMNILVLARLPVALLGAVSCALMFPLGKYLVNRTVGVVGSLFLLSEPLWILSSRRAMTDIVAVFFAVLGMCMYVRYRRTQPTRPLLWVSLIGIVFGTAVEAKYSMLMVVVAVVVIELATAIEHRWDPQSLRRITVIQIPLVRYLLFLGSFSFAFIVLNPFIWPAPLSQLSLLTHTLPPRGWWFIQPSIFSVDNLIWAAGYFNVVIFPLFVGNFGSVSLSWQYPGTFSTVPIATLFLVGIAVVLFAVKKFDSFVRITLVLWLATYFIFISLTLRIFFDRYFLPLLPPICVVAAIGFDRVKEFCRTKREQLAFVVMTSVLSIWAAVSASQNLWGGWSTKETMGCAIWDGLCQSIQGPQFATIQASVGSPIGFMLGAIYLLLVGYLIGNGLLEASRKSLLTP